MDQHAERRRDDQHVTDLAAIVLGLDEQSRRRDAPEFVPLDAADGRAQQGFDARSAAVLALVVAILAALVGWATTIDRPSATSMTEPAPATSTDHAGADAATTGDPASASGAAGNTTADDAAIAPVPGVDLAIGRVVPAAAGSGTGLVAIGIGNRGSVAFRGRPAATVLLLVDGDVVATEPVPAIEPGESTRVSVALDWCPAGTVSVTAVIDPSAAVRESDERNNATSRSATFAC